jgi:peptidyl-tRNA hydrolase
MTHIDIDQVPRVVLVFNGPLKMSPGKMAAQAFQACQRLHEAIPLERYGEVKAWQEHTTTIARVAKTTAMFDRVCGEVPGVVMVDEGYTEVDPDTPTVFASWPALRTEEHKLLSNAKVQLVRETVDLFAGWTDENLQAAAAGIAAEPLSAELITAVRAEAASRHLQLNGVPSDLWLT